MGYASDWLWFVFCQMGRSHHLPRGAQHVWNTENHSKPVSQSAFDWKIDRSVSGTYAAVSLWVICLDRCNVGMDQIDHFHLSIVKEMFRLTLRDYSVYWLEMVSPSRNLCMCTGQERYSPMLHLAGITCSTVHRSCCFLWLWNQGTKLFTRLKDWKLYLWHCLFRCPDFTWRMKLELTVVQYIFTELWKIV